MYFWTLCCNNSSSSIYCWLMSYYLTPNKTSFIVLEPTSLKSFLMLVSETFFVCSSCSARSSMLESCFPGALYKCPVVFVNNSYWNWHFVSCLNKSCTICASKQSLVLNSRIFYFSLSKMHMKISCLHMLDSSIVFLRSMDFLLHKVTFLYFESSM